MELLKQIDFDGIDVDWEYPVCCGEAKNQVSANDWDNYLALLRETRDRMDREFPSVHKELTIAMGMSPSITGAPCCTLWRPCPCPIP